MMNDQGLMWSDGKCYKWRWPKIGVRACRQVTLASASASAKGDSFLLYFLFCTRRARYTMSGGYVINLYLYVATWSVVPFARLAQVSASEPLLSWRCVTCATSKLATWRLCLTHECLSDRLHGQWSWLSLTVTAADNIFHYATKLITLLASDSWFVRRVTIPGFYLFAYLLICLMPIAPLPVYPISSYPILNFTDLSCYHRYLSQVPCSR